jgi:hypothetical protein
MTAARIGCLAMLLAAAGCYESPQPLGTPDQGVVDGALVGTWRCAKAHLFVVAFDRTQYYLEWSEDRKVDRYRAYSTPVEGQALYNVTALEPSPSPTTWIFMRARQKAGALSISVVDKDSLKDPGPGALKEIARRVADDALYKPWADCTKEE